MKPFSRNELIGVGLILLVTLFATLTNLRVALRRSRDVQRRTDLNDLAGALVDFSADYGFFPPAKDGQILSCKGENFDAKISEVLAREPFDRSAFFTLLTPCNWGKDALTDLLDPSSPAYIKNIPQDPKSSQGISYLYFSDENRFQIYGYLEGQEDEIGYDKAIVARGLACGNKICNFGKAYAQTPLDKSLEEYENELLEKSR